MTAYLYIYICLQFLNSLDFNYLPWDSIVCNKFFALVERHRFIGACTAYGLIKISQNLQFLSVGAEE